jgi:gliding motility-associated-like protein
LTAGLYTFTITDNNGCTTTVDATITQPAEALTAALTSQVNVLCFGGTNGSAIITPAGGTAPYIITPVQIGLTVGLHTFTVTDYNGCTTTVDATITQLGKGEVITLPSSACNLDSSTVNLNSLLPTGTPINGTWTDVNDTEALQGSILSPLGIALGDYDFEYKINTDDCPGSIIIKMNINDDCVVLACGNILVHNAFSPNGDTKNETFIIDNIDDTSCYPNNTVEIYNRWGVLVFETRNYNNESNYFDGISRGRTTISQSSGLPTGTYYYILNYNSIDGNGNIQTNTKDGYLYLTR